MNKIADNVFSVSSLLEKHNVMEWKHFHNFLGQGVSKDFPQV